jgi:Fe-only nitrogenase accessory protein AnfO
MRIAALVDAAGETLPINASGTLVVFENDGEWWGCIAEIPFSIDNRASLRGIREYIHEVAGRPLSGCRALLVRQTMGIFTAIFEEELHVHLFAVQGSPKPVLDEIKERIRAEIRDLLCRKTKSLSHGNSIQPIVMGDPEEGRYCIDLVKVQENHEGMNSKDILLPFFKTVTFNELEIICLHVPKWIERELINFHFKVIIENRKDGRCHVFVIPTVTGITYIK